MNQVKKPENAPAKKIRQRLAMAVDLVEKKAKIEYLPSRKYVLFKRFLRVKSAIA
jgi:hypothetical protein